MKISAWARTDWSDGPGKTIEVESTPSYSFRGNGKLEISVEAEEIQPSKNTTREGTVLLDWAEVEQIFLLYLTQSKTPITESIALLFIEQLAKKLRERGSVQRG